MITFGQDAIATLRRCVTVVLGFGLLLSLAFAPVQAQGLVWNPGQVNVTVIQGTTQTSSLQFTVPATIDQASLFVVPEIAGLVRMSLFGQTVLNPGAPIQAGMEINIAGTTPLGTYSGTVHIRYRDLEQLDDILRRLEAGRG